MDGMLDNINPKAAELMLTNPDAVEVLVKRINFLKDEISTTMELEKTEDSKVSVSSYIAAMLDAMQIQDVTIAYGDPVPLYEFIEEAKAFIAE